MKGVFGRIGSAAKHVINKVSVPLGGVIGSVIAPGVGTAIGSSIGGIVHRLTN